MKKFRHYLYMMAMVVAAALALTACGIDDDDDAPDPPGEGCGDREDAPASRVVLVYMVANNNLGGYFDTNDLNEMKQGAMAGALGDGRLLVFRHGYNSSTGEMEQRLFEILPDGTESTLENYSLDISSVSIERMRAVLDDAESVAPAASRGLMLWSHADGWLNIGYENPGAEAASLAAAGKRGFGLDGSKKMSISALREALDGRYFDFIYFDCCYMASVEVMYELRQSAGAFVGSAAELPADGARYHEALPYLFASALDLPGAAAASFDYYLRQNSSGCTLSVVRASALDALAQATARVYATRPAQPGKSDVQEFQRARYLYFDLEDYMEHLVPDDASLLAAWKETLAEAVMYQGATARINMVYRYDVNHHCGITTHILFTPEDAENQGYNTLQWYRDVASLLYE